MHKCPICNATLTGNPDFCINCGVKLTIICKSCGKKISGNPQFCPYCNVMIR